MSRIRDRSRRSYRKKHAINIDSFIEDIGSDAVNILINSVREMDYNLAPYAVLAIIASILPEALAISFLSKLLGASMAKTVISIVSRFRQKNERDLNELASKLRIELGLTSEEEEKLLDKLESFDYNKYVETLGKENTAIILALAPVLKELKAKLKTVEGKVERLELLLSVRYERDLESLGVYLGLQPRILAKGVVRYERLEKLAARIVEDVKRGMTVIVAGPPGIGKTVLLYLATQKLVNEGWKAAITSLTNPTGLEPNSFILVPELNREYKWLLARTSIAALSSARSHDLRNLLSGSGEERRLVWMRWDSYLARESTPSWSRVIVVELTSSLYDKSHLMAIARQTFEYITGRIPGEEVLSVIEEALGVVEPTPLCAALIGERVAKGVSPTRATRSRVQCLEYITDILAHSSDEELLGLAIVSYAANHSIHELLLKRIASAINADFRSIVTFLERRIGGEYMAPHPLWLDSIQRLLDKRPSLQVLVGEALSRVQEAFADVLAKLEKSPVSVREAVISSTVENFPQKALETAYKWRDLGLDTASLILIGEATARLLKPELLNEFIANTGLDLRDIDPGVAPRLWLYYYEKQAGKEGYGEARCDGEYTRARVLYRLGAINEALETVNHILTLEGECTPGTIARALLLKGIILQSVNKPAEAVEALRNVVKVISKDDPRGLVAARALMYLGRALHALGRYREALETYIEAEEVFRDASAYESREMYDAAWLHVYKGSALLWLARYEEALREFEIAEDKFRRLQMIIAHGTVDPARRGREHLESFGVTTGGGGPEIESKLAIALMNKALVLISIGEYLEAIKTIEDAEDIANSIVNVQRLREHIVKLVLILMYKAYIYWRTWKAGIKSIDIYLAQEIAEDSVNYYQKLITEGRVDQLQGYARALLVAGLISKDLGDIEKASYYFKKTIDTVRGLIENRIYWMLELGIIAAYHLGSYSELCYFYSLAVKESINMEFFVPREIISKCSDVCSNLI
ncbi:MAG: tetratricopeptide repeat protein [Desulfurococcales archaeon]|nr:tetratricopeptide repeat protein [Desulfurococcales archaeon]